MALASSVESLPSVDFKAVFQAATGLYLVLTPELRIVAASDQYLAATMRRREELVGRNIFDAFPDNPDDPTATGERNLRGSLLRVLKIRTADRMADQKYDIQRPDAEGGEFEERYWSPLNSPVLGPDGEVTYIIHRVEDITRRKNAEATANRLTEQLQRLNEELEQRVHDRTAQLEELNRVLTREIEQRQLAEERFRRTVDAAPMGMLMVNKMGQIALANQEAERLFGYQSGELLGQSVEALLPQRFRSQHENHRQGYFLAPQARLMRTGRELFGQRKDGSEFPVEVGLNPVETSEGSFVLSAIADITERKRTEERLRFTQFTIDHVATPVLWTDAEGRFFNVNDAACRLTGYEREELLRLGVYDIDTGLTPAGWLDAWRELRQRGALTLESEIRRKDGRKVPISLSSNLLKLDDRECSCTFIQDVAERRKLEEQLRQSQKMEAVGQLAGGVAHDFNNLLTIITGYSDIVLESLPPSDPLCEMVEEIQKAAHRSSSLTRQLLAFSRKQVLAPKVLDLNEVVRDTEKMLRRVIGEDVQLTTKLHSRLAPVKADPGQLEQVLLNLAVNARDAMPHGGVLTIETNNVELDADYVRARGSTRDGLHVMLAVTDSGIGMDAEVKRHIFEPFFTTKEQGKGTGLGLAVVHGVVKQSGGHVEVYSEPGIGTSFKISLPSANQMVRTDKGSGGASRVPHGTETVLIVEDEDGVRNLSRAALMKYGYTVLAASSPGQAVQVSQANGGTIDLLLTDVVMPQMNGRRLAELLCAERPDMKVIFMSGYTDDAVVQQGVLNAGVNFLHKPFSTAALGVKVREVLDGAAIAANP